MKATDMRTVSVIMPCFNHAAFIEESARSVLDQQHQAVELIIVDDCSADNSWEVITRLAASDPRIKAIRHTRNGGAAKSRNDGIASATGDFIAFCDADDLWERDKLTIQLGLLDRHPDHDVVYGDSRIIDGQGNLTGKRFSDLFPPPSPASGWLFARLVRTNFINTMGLLMRRECVTRVGVFDEKLKGASVEDWWYWIQIAHQHRFIYTSESLGRYRMHSGSTAVHRNYRVTRYKVFRRMLKTYSDLPAAVRSRGLLAMAVELFHLGKVRASRRLLWRALTTAVSAPNAYPVAARALQYLITMSADNRKAVSS